MTVTEAQRLVDVMRFGRQVKFTNTIDEIKLRTDFYFESMDRDGVTMVMQKDWFTGQWRVWTDGIEQGQPELN